MNNTATQLNAFREQAKVVKELAANGADCLKKLQTHLETDWKDDLWSITLESNGSRLLVSFYGLRLDFRIEIEFPVPQESLASITAYRLPDDKEPKEITLLDKGKYTVNLRGVVLRWNDGRGARLEDGFAAAFLNEVFSKLTQQPCILPRFARAVPCHDLQPGGTK